MKFAWKWSLVCLSSTWKSHFKCTIRVLQKESKILLLSLSPVKLTNLIELAFSFTAATKNSRMRGIQTRKLCFAIHKPCNLTHTATLAGVRNCKRNHLKQNFDRNQSAEREFSNLIISQVWPYHQKSYAPNLYRGNIIVSFSYKDVR